MPSSSMAAAADAPNSVLMWSRAPDSAEFPTPSPWPPRAQGRPRHTATEKRMPSEGCLCSRRGKSERPRTDRSRGLETQPSAIWRAGLLLLLLLGRLGLRLGLALGLRRHLALGVLLFLGPAAILAGVTRGHVLDGAAGGRLLRGRCLLLLRRRPVGEGSKDSCGKRNSQRLEQCGAHGSFLPPLMPAPISTRADEWPMNVPHARRAQASACSRRSSPQNSSSPTRKDGEPKMPRACASSVCCLRRCLMSGCSMRAKMDAESSPKPVSSAPSTARSEMSAPPANCAV